MTQRYAKLGALMNLPIIANVFVITISYYFAFTPVITGLMLIANILLVLWDWNTLKVLINLAPQPDETLRLENDNIWQLLGVLLFAIVVITNMSLSARVMSIAFVVGLFIGLTGLIIGLKRKKRYHIV